ncbi:aminotransferase class I/II-fold pyridoxal phosphate-dependent enzyme [Mesobacillus subterraneus]|uniref:Aminotransferase class I/II-fold pyridoxal phosphate-dependent enzyme n=1 Tax=Mesobacillus subterraneus TaxID=285983 RepID=A0A3R9DQA6_9BACI|nr:aminotransferase class I/II-fold pyridoxal phosphate-dependent enzyme [Mesobacillus subterraneus]RSD24523.1 aminotransferase class I/II-fold pyridoxal phosphate-dependent enzyme [Mesobacillus subterraneus]
MDQSKTPLYSQLVNHHGKKPISFHVPGHKYGDVYPNEGQAFFKDVLKLDATEITGLDDLHSPEGVILEAENLLAELYNTNKSFLLINGSTVGNLAMILSAIDEGDRVLVQRNSHKSVMNALKLAKANPVWVSPEYNQEYGAAAGLSTEAVDEALRQFPDAKAIILTYPNYYGLTYDLKGIIDLAHQHDIPVLVDEAHGVHFIAGDYFPPSAVELGADVVVQSAHKTLPAMTMGAYLHHQTNRVPLSKLQFYLQALQSSSPSYPLMASLDLARSYLGTYKDEDVSYLRDEIESFRQRIDQLDTIKILKADDPLKMTIQAKGLSGFELQRLLEDKGIFTELADPYNVLFVLSLLKKGMVHDLREAAERIAEASASIPNGMNQPEYRQMNKKVTTLAVGYKEMDSLQTEFVSLDFSVGRICAESIIPYPPGIPLCLPGELVSDDDVHVIQYLRNKQAKIQGGEKLHAGEIKVYKSWGI